MCYMQIVLLVFLTHLALITSIKFEDKGYEEIVIALGEKVIEHDDFIDNLEKFFERASQILFTAMRGKAYFKQITVVAPKDWERKLDFTYKANVFSTSDIRIDQRHPVYGDNAYTVQPGICGEPGIYIHFSENLFLNTLCVEEDEIARVIVYHWARFRYGIFEEHPDPMNPIMYPPFYIKDGEMLPATCVANISGWAVSDREEMCTVSNGKVLNDCTFYLDPNHPKEMTASLMSYPCFSSNEDYYFCDEETKERMHNRLVPTKHNDMCSYNSTFDIIKSHKDFGDISKDDWPKKAPSRKPKDPTFKWKKLKELSQRYVLLLDGTEGMSEDYRIKLLKEATIRFLKDLVPEESYVGIVSLGCGGIVHILSPMIQITNDTVREALSQDVQSNITADDVTSLNKAFQEVLKMLKDKKIPAEGTSVVLLSRGLNYVDNVSKSVWEKIEKSRVTIHTIAFGLLAVDRIRNMSNLTGGLTFYFDPTEARYSGTEAIDLAFLEIIKTQATDDRQPFLVYSEIKEFKGGQMNYKFLIERELGTNTSVSVIPNVLIKSSAIGLELKGPEGESFDRDSPEQENDETARRAIIRISDAKSGEWKLTVKKLSPVSLYILVMVISHPKPKFRYAPVRVRGWLSIPLGGVVRFISGGNPPRPLRIFAEVYKGYYPVINAKVTAMVIPPDRDKGVVVRLLDNGSGADTRKYDGIYSAYFMNMSDISDFHTVIVKAVDNGEAKLIMKIRESPSLPESCYPPAHAHGPSTSPFRLSDFRVTSRGSLHDTEQYLSTIPVNPFRRYADAGYFKVHGWSEEHKNQVPPSRVTDLKVVATQLLAQSLRVTLSWTASGLYLDQGTVPFLQLWGHATIDSLMSTANSSDANLHEAPEMIAPAGTKITTSIDVPVEDLSVETVSDTDTIYEYYFAIRSVSSHGLISDTSNIAVAHYIKVQASQIKPDGGRVPDDKDGGGGGVGGVGDDDNGGETQDDTETILKSPMVLWYALGAVAVIIVGVAIGFGVRKWLKSRSKRRFPFSVVTDLAAN